MQGKLQPHIYLLPIYWRPPPPPPRRMQLLRTRNFVSPGDLVVVVSDIRAELDGVVDTVRSVQVRHVA